jgi:CcmD family protein
MEKRYFKSIALIAGLFACLFAKAQEAASRPEMADALRANGKIYVVVTVLLIIFIGIVVYLISIDRKATRLQNELNELKK